MLSDLFVALENQNPVTVSGAVVSRRNEIFAANICKWCAFHFRIFTICRIVPVSLN